MLDDMMTNMMQQPDGESKQESVEVIDAPLSQRLRYHPENGPTRFHDFILQRLTARLDMSYRAMQSRHTSWDAVDEKLRLYARPVEPKRKTTADGSGERKDVIVLPVSYAIFQVRLAQLFGLWASRSPLFPVIGVGPEDIDAAKYVEAALHYDAQMSNALLALYSFFADAERYGAAWLCDWWETEYGWKETPPSPGQMMMYNMLKFMGKNPVRPSGEPEWALLREYNAVACRDPRLMYPDPRVPLSDLKSAEFIGEKQFKSVLELVAKSEENGGFYFNVDAVRKRVSGKDLGSIDDYGATRRASRRGTETDLLGTPSGFASDANDSVRVVPIEHIRIRLIPREWQLGPQDKPEIWWFEIADESVIIRAHRSIYLHGEFGYSYGESQFDPHCIANPGSLELVYGLQRAIDWLFRSHFENIRRALNNMLIYSPTLIEENDILNPGPMQHIRLTQVGEQMLLSGQLQSPSQAIQQLQVADITTPHLQAMSQLFDMAQRMLATSDPQMSSITEARRTLGEIQAIISSSSQRIGILGRLLDIMAIQPLVRRLIKNRQQFTSMEQWVALAGELADRAGLKRILISPENLAGSFDYDLLDVAATSDPARSSEAWMLFMQSAGTLARFPGFGIPDPTTGEVFDIKAAFKEFVKVLGVRNVDKFFKRVMPPQPPDVPGMPMQPPGVQVMPDEQVRAMAEYGDLEPV